MWSDVIGVLLGIGFIAPTLVMIRSRGLDVLAWPAFLITLPIWYALFGLLAMDVEVIFQELAYGLPYFLLGFMLWRTRTRLGFALVGIAWLTHGFYDLYHDLLFVNPGVFVWYPAFCGAIDLMVGSYLLFLASNGAHFSRVAAS